MHNLTRIRKSFRIVFLTKCVPDNFKLGLAINWHFGINCNCHTLPFKFSKVLRGFLILSMGFEKWLRKYMFGVQRTLNFKANEALVLFVFQNLTNFPVIKGKLQKNNRFTFFYNPLLHEHLIYFSVTICRFQFWNGRRDHDFLNRVFKEVDRLKG